MPSGVSNLQFARLINNKELGSTKRSNGRMGIVFDLLILLRWRIICEILWCDTSVDAKKKMNAMIATKIRKAM